MKLHFITSKETLTAAFSPVTFFIGQSVLHKVINPILIENAYYFLFVLFSAPIFFLQSFIRNA